MSNEPVDALQIPSSVCLLLHVAALRLQIKRLQAEVTDLKARVTMLEGAHAD
jgi:hypothetical protein